MQIRWHGHSFFSLVTKGGKLVLVDPFFAVSSRRVADFQPDLILLTHAHADHVGSTAEFGVPVVATHELALLLASKGVEAHGMNLGGSFRGLEGVRIWMAPALHSSGFDADATPIAHGGVACGYVVDDGETRFYHTGDTALFGDMRTVVRDIVGPHVAAVPIGDLYTMGVEHAAKAVEWLGVSAAIPMHYDTFPAIEADPARFQELVGKAAQTIVPKVDGGVEMRGRDVVRMLEP